MPPAAAQEPVVGAPRTAGSTVILLGTAGGPIVRKNRAQPASLLVVDGRYYLIDAGDGVTRQLAQLGITPSMITAVFLTHHHLDHTAGLGSLMAFRWFLANAGARIPALPVYGPPGTADLAAAATRYFATSEAIFRTATPTAPVKSNTVKAADVAPGPIYHDDKVRVTVVENSHYGSVKMTPGPHGIDRSYSLRFDTRHGSVLFTGDTGPSAAVNKLARNVDLLVSEIVDVPSIMAMINRQPDLPRASVRNIEAHMRDEHLTPEAVGRMAAAAGAKKVLLTHYATLDDTAAAEAKYVAAVRSIYRGPVIAGRDLMQEPVAAKR